MLIGVMCSECAWGREFTAESVEVVKESKQKMLRGTIILLFWRLGSAIEMGP